MLIEKSVPVKLRKCTRCGHFECPCCGDFCDEPACRELRSACAEIGACVYTEARDKDGFDMLASIEGLAQGFATSFGLWHYIEAATSGRSVSVVVHDEDDAPDAADDWSKRWDNSDRLRLVVMLTSLIRRDIDAGRYGQEGRPNIQTVHECIAADRLTLIARERQFRAWASEERAKTTFVLVPGAES